MRSTELAKRDSRWKFARKEVDVLLDVKRTNVMKQLSKWLTDLVKDYQYLALRDYVDFVIVPIAWAAYPLATSAELALEIQKEWQRAADRNDREVSSINDNIRLCKTIMRDVRARFVELALKNEEKFNRQAERMKSATGPLRIAHKLTYVAATDFKEFADAKRIAVAMRKEFPLMPMSAYATIWEDLTAKERSNIVKARPVRKRASRDGSSSRRSTKEKSPVNKWVDKMRDEYGPLIQTALVTESENAELAEKSGDALVDLFARQLHAAIRFNNNVYNKALADRVYDEFVAKMDEYSTEMDVICHKKKAPQSVAALEIVLALVRLFLTGKDEDIKHTLE